MNFFLKRKKLIKLKVKLQHNCEKSQKEFSELEQLLPISFKLLKQK